MKILKQMYGCMEVWRDGNDNSKRRWIATQPAVARNDGHSSVIPHSDAVSRSLSSRTERGERESCCACSAVRRCRSGFTLVELVIVIAIVIILSVVSVPIYRGYTRNAKMSEGYALLGTILSAQKTFYSEKGYFYVEFADPSVFSCMDTTLNIDARGNKYFTAFNSGYISVIGDNKFKIKIGTLVPKDLRSSDSKSILLLSYNLTEGDKTLFKVTENIWD